MDLPWSDWQSWVEANCRDSVNYRHYDLAVPDMDAPPSDRIQKVAELSSVWCEAQFEVFELLSGTLARFSRRWQCAALRAEHLPEYPQNTTPKRAFVDRYLSRQSKHDPKH